MLEVRWWAGPREQESLGEEAPDPPVHPPRLRGRSLTCLLGCGARSCPSFVVRDLTIVGAWGGAAAPSSPSRDPATSDPHVFGLLLGCLSPLPPPLMTSATTLLQNYLVAVLISLCGHLIKIASSTSFSWGLALSSRDGPLSWPLGPLCPCLGRLLGETSLHQIPSHGASHCSLHQWPHPKVL